MKSTAVVLDKCQQEVPELTQPWRSMLGTAVVLIAGVSLDEYGEDENIFRYLKNYELFVIKYVLILASYLSSS